MCAFLLCYMTISPRRLTKWILLLLFSYKLCILVQSELELATFCFPSQVNTDLSTAYVTFFKYVVYNEAAQCENC